MTWYNLGMGEEDFDDEEEAEEQPKNKQPRITPLLPYMWKKGQSGNPAGRPKGKTMKDYAREMLECMTDEERQEFMHGLPKEIIWKMAEGNPANSTALTGKDGGPIQIQEVQISFKE
jgi:hypothetical protein